MSEDPRISRTSGIDIPAESRADLPSTSSPPALSHRLFFGADGLRASWSLLIFFVIISLLILPTIPIFRHQLAQQTPAPHTTAAHGPVERGVSATLTQDGLLFAVLLVSSFVMSRIERRPFASYGIGATPQALRQLFTGLLWGVLFLSLLILLLRSIHLLVFDARLLSAAAIPRFAAEWALGFLFVSLFEEYFLRGFLLFTLARGLSGIYAAILKSPHTDALGFWTAATLLAFVFGLGHRANPGESSIGLLTAGVAALVFSLSLWRTGSLWWAIGFHAAWDWAQSFLYGVADSGIMMRHHLFATHPVGTPLLSGGLTGPEGSVFVLPLLLAVAAVIWVTLPQTPRPSGPLLEAPGTLVTARDSL
jgi:membrane protease YdiL (CAAX protease family)